VRVALAAGLALRPRTEADRAFLEQLFCSVRWEELAPTGWPEDAKIDFLTTQFDYQQRHYAIAHEGADLSIVECDGVPIGRFDVDRTGAELWLIDISLLPQWRGKGIGGALIAQLQDEARTGPAGRVGLNVDRTNPNAYRLYQRLGFVEAPPTSPYPTLSIEMNWTPAGAQDAS